MSPCYSLRSSSTKAALIAAFCVFGCASAPPVDEYNIAYVALSSARSSEAHRYAPTMWFSAEEAFNAGKALYQQRDFSSAKEKFIEARIAAERAENASRLSKTKDGEVF